MYRVFVIDILVIQFRINEIGLEISSVNRSTLFINYIKYRNFWKIGLTLLRKFFFISIFFFRMKNEIHLHSREKRTIFR